MRISFAATCLSLLSKKFECHLRSKSCPQIAKQTAADHAETHMHPLSVRRSTGARESSERKTRNHIRVGKNTNHLNDIIVTLIVFNFPHKETVGSRKLRHRKTKGHIGVRRNTQNLSNIVALILNCLRPHCLFFFSNISRRTSTRLAFLFILLACDRALGNALTSFCLPNPSFGAPQPPHSIKSMLKHMLDHNSRKLCTTRAFTLEPRD